MREGTRARAGGCVSPASLWTPTNLSDSPWLSRAPFVFWLMDSIRPQAVAIIGSPDGQLRGAIEEAIGRLGLDTEITEVSDDARPKAPAPQSIDLLVIAGADSASDLRLVISEFASSLSDDSVVLVPNVSGGSASSPTFRDAWLELAQRHPAVELAFAQGIGVLAPRRSVPAGVEPLFAALSDPRKGALVNDFYALLGTRADNDRELAETRLLIGDAQRRGPNASAERIRLLVRRECIEQRRANATREIEDLAAKLASPSMVESGTPTNSGLRAKLGRRLRAARWVRGKAEVPGGSTAASTDVHRPKDDDRIRVALVSGEPRTAGHRYRVADVAEALSRGGFEVCVMNLGQFPSKKQEIARAQVVWMWRVPFTPKARRLVDTARQANAVLITDVDDLIFDPDLVAEGLIDGVRSIGYDPQAIERSFERHRSTLEHGDLRTTTTAYLAEVMQRQIGPTLVIPNGYDEASWRMSALAASVPSTDEVIRLGYAGGSLTHQKDLAVAIPAVARVLHENPQVRLVLFRGFVDIDEFPELAPVAAQIEWRDAVPLSLLPFEYARFDINLAPLELNNAFCAAKSTLKFHEAALVCVPTIASPTPPFRAVIEHGRNGLLVDSRSDWYDAIASLVSDSGVRNCIGYQARVDAIWRFGPLRRATLVSRAVNAASGGDPAEYDWWLDRTEVAFPKVQSKSVVPRFQSITECPGSFTVVVTLGEVDDPIEVTLKKVAESVPSGVDLIVIDVIADHSRSQQIDSWLTKNYEQFALCQSLSVSDDASVWNALNEIFGSSRTLEVVILSPLDPCSIEAAPHAFWVSATGNGACRLVQRGLESGSKDSKQMEPGSCFRVSVEGWAAVGGFTASHDSMTDLFDRIAAFGLPVSAIAS